MVPNALCRNHMAMFLTQWMELLDKIRQLQLDIILPNIEIELMASQLQPHL